MSKWENALGIFLTVVLTALFAYSLIYGIVSIVFWSEPYGNLYGSRGSYYMAE